MLLLTNMKTLSPRSDILCDLDTVYVSVRAESHNSAIVNKNGTVLQLTKESEGPY